MKTETRSRLQTQGKLGEFSALGFSAIVLPAGAFFHALIYLTVSNLDGIKDLIATDVILVKMG